MIFNCSIKGSFMHEYTGERSMQDMVDYANRMSQPAVQRLSQADTINYLKEIHSIFFGYIGNLQGPLWVISLYSIFLRRVGCTE